MEVFLPSGLMQEVEESVAYSHKMYIEHVATRIYGITNPREAELARHFDDKYQLEALFQLFGGPKDDMVLVTATKFLGYKYNNSDYDFMPLNWEKGQMPEGLRPVGILRSHPDLMSPRKPNASFSESDLSILPSLRETFDEWGRVMLLYDEPTKTYKGIGIDLKELKITWYSEES